MATDDHDNDDKVARAEAQVRQWQIERREAFRGKQFYGYSSADLIKVAKTNRDLDGAKLGGIEWAEFDEAWWRKFGERFFGESDFERIPVTAANADQHPILALPDDAMVRGRQLLVMLGDGKTTLKRWRREGSFPKPQPLAPGSTRIGWPARQLKAWLRLRDDEMAGRA